MGEVVDTATLVSNKKVTRALPCVLSDKELTSQARRLADLTQEIGNAQDAEKQRKTEAKGHIARLETERNAVCTIVASGRQNRDVECTLYFDFTAKRAVLVRDDTGEEVENRRLTDGEAQSQFQFDQEAPVASDEQLDALAEALEGTPEAADTDDNTHVEPVDNGEGFAADGDDEAR